MDSLAISSATAVAATAQQPLSPASTQVEKSPSSQPKEAAAKTDRTATSKAAAPERDTRSMEFQVEGDRVITTIIDDQSKAVVVQIPDAELIRIAKSIDRMQGFFIEQKA